MINEHLHPHQQYTAKFDPISKIYNIYFWLGIEKRIQYSNSIPILEDYLVGDLIDTAKTEKEVWEKLLVYRTSNQTLSSL
jgi:hypothetical protein